MSLLPTYPKFPQLQSRSCRFCRFRFWQERRGLLGNTTNEPPPIHVSSFPLWFSSVCPSLTNRPKARTVCLSNSDSVCPNSDKMYLTVVTFRFLLLFFAYYENTTHSPFQFVDCPLLSSRRDAESKTTTCLCIVLCTISYLTPSQKMTWQSRVRHSR